jgi:hypothetical protein
MGNDTKESVDKIPKCECISGEAKMALDLAIKKSSKSITILKNRL